MPTLEIMEATMSGIASTKFPSVTSLALSIVSSILLLALIRAAFTRLVTISDITDDKSTHPGCNPNPSPAQDSSYQATSSWTWSKNWRWEGLPLSLPVSLAINEKDRPGVGEGMGVAAAMQQLQREQRQPPKMTWQKHRRSPAFQAPLPTLYDTPVPMSMAKMIMSRHTYRRPSPNRPLPRPPPAQIRPVSQPPSRPLHSMV